MRRKIFHLTTSVTSIMFCFMITPMSWDFLYAWRLCFNNVAVYMMVINSLSFILSKNIFILTLFLKYVFVEYRLLSWQFLSFGSEDVATLFPGLQNLSCKVGDNFYHFWSKSNVFFLPISLCFIEFHVNYCSLIVLL